MKTAKIDTSPWNLGLPLVLLTACGPAVPIDEVESATDTDAGETEDTITVSTVNPEECRDDSECEGYGFDCIDGRCVYVNDYCSDGGCCDDGCCYEGCWYPECYEDDECGPGNVCEYNYCTEAPMPVACEGGPSLFGGVPIFANDEPILSLAFVEATADPGRELLVVTPSGIHLVTPQGGSALVVAEPSESVAVADLDGDGIEDLVVGAFDEVPLLRTYLGIEGGGFAAHASDERVGHRVGLGDLDANGFVDLVSGDEAGVVRRPGDGLGGFGTPSVLVAPASAAALHMLPPARHPFAQLLAYDGTQLVLWRDAFGDASFELTGTAYLASERALAVGDHDGDGETDVSAILLEGDTAIVTTWRTVDDLSGESTQWVPPGVPSLAATGDLDGDGRDELVVGSSSELWVRFGESVDVDGDGLGCYLYGALPGIGASWLGLEDFDGDGNADVISADGTTVWWTQTR